MKVEVQTTLVVRPGFDHSCNRIERLTGIL